MVLRVAALLLVLCAPAAIAQSYELAGYTGAGGITGEDVSGGMATFGVAFRPGLPLRIDHQGVVPMGAGPTGIHLFTAGWFKQAKTDSVTFYGPSVGAGVSVTLRDRFFLRPEIQVKMLGPGPFVIVLPALGAGFRF